ncbi:hypothetical protein [Flavobacterium sp.]|uniref:hypothetical protein n=1 Tax=Flavobacterium sp. TaxID=239 RepID=UPI00263939E1|nr:hypothetical protein [Flavobacterium sp.]
MKHFLLIFVVAICLFSCKNNDSEMKVLQDKLDSIDKKLEELKKESKEKDTTIIPKDSLSKKPQIKKLEEKAKEEKPIQSNTKTSKPNTSKEKIPTVIKPSNDTTYYYFSDGKLSVKVAPRSDRQKIWIYFPNGKVSYELENIRMSYTCFNDLFFRKNGAVEKIESSLNPGASMYMYSSVIYFDENNLPSYKIDEKTPSTLEDHMNNKSVWDSKNKRWIKQEDRTPKIKE